MRAAGIGLVIDSRHPDYRVGEHVYGVFGVQRYAVSDGAGVTRVDLTLAPAPVHLGVLGISGLTAYFGLLDVGRPEPGQTVVVSGAAGSVGSVAGQIARIKGCRAIGIAGGKTKCAWLTGELGFDAAIDYKAEDVGGLVVNRGVEPQLVNQPAALLLAPGDADRAAALDPRDLADDVPD